MDRVVQVGGCDWFRPTITLIPPSIPRLIKDDGLVPYSRASAQGCKEHQGSILTVLGIAEGPRDALPKYQVGSDYPHGAVVSLELGPFTHPAVQYPHHSLLSPTPLHQQAVGSSTDAPPTHWKSWASSRDTNLFVRSHTVIWPWELCT